MGGAKGPDGIDESGGGAAGPGAFGEATQGTGLDRVDAESVPRSGGGSDAVLAASGVAGEGGIFGAGGGPKAGGEVLAGESSADRHGPT